MEQRIVTVFGAAGFLGRAVVQKLADQGYLVRAVVRHPERALFLRSMGRIGQVTPLYVNIEDDTSLAAALKGAWGVVNLIGILYEKKLQTFEKIHKNFPRQLGRVAQDQKVQRLVHISALGVNPSSASCYSQTKAAGEKNLHQTFPKATILRPSLLIGPQDNFLNRFATLARLSPFLPVFQGGETKFQPVYVGDVAEAVLVALFNPKHQGKTYALGGPAVYSYRELMIHIAKVTHRPRPILSLPFFLGRLIGWVTEFLPKPPLTRDMIALMQQDSIIEGETPSFKELGINPRSLEDVSSLVLPMYRKVF
jgi:uncharacterized protein YbjT (DUF2867 family)